MDDRASLTLYPKTRFTIPTLAPGKTPNTRSRFFGIKDVREKGPSGGITLVEQLTLYPKIKGYNPNAGTRNDP